MKVRRMFVGGVALVVPLALAAPASANPGNVYQGYALPASGNCDNALTDAPQANVPGAPAGGWKISWGSWLNGGKGGPACVRTLVYNNGTKTWNAQ